MNGILRQVYVVGPGRLQNELMVCKLFCQTGIKCQVLDKLEQVPLYPDNSPAVRRLILLDVQGADHNSLLNILRELKLSALPGQLVALYNVKRSTGLETKALEVGIKGFFYDDDSVESFTKGVGNIFDGDIWVSRKQMVECLLLGHCNHHHIKSRDHNLTHREEEILSLVAEGRTNEQIAHQLCVSHHTIRTHVYNIFKKIHVSNRLQASNWASDHLMN